MSKWRDLCGTPGVWEEYAAGTYRKRYCDVRLLDGTELGPCWPNAHYFYPLDEANGVHEANVKEVRYYARDAKNAQVA
jgi:hypothetical protein